MVGKKPEIDNIWLEKTPLGYAVRLDWDNDRHHSSVIDPPYGAEQLHYTLIRLASMINNDRHLTG